MRSNDNSRNFYIRLSTKTRRVTVQSKFQGLIQKIITPVLSVRYSHVLVMIVNLKE